MMKISSDDYWKYWSEYLWAIDEFKIMDCDDWGRCLVDSKICIYKVNDEN